MRSNARPQTRSAPSRRVRVCQLSQNLIGDWSRRANFTFGFLFRLPWITLVKSSRFIFHSISFTVSECPLDKTPFQLSPEEVLLVERRHSFKAPLPTPRFRVILSRSSIIRILGCGRTPQYYSLDNRVLRFLQLTFFLHMEYDWRVSLVFSTFPRRGNDFRNVLHLGFEF
jgi:hypothetical protein